jgi:hypothetical protein
MSFQRVPAIVLGFLAAVMAMPVQQKTLPGRGVVLAQAAQPADTGAKKTKAKAKQKKNETTTTQGPPPAPVRVGPPDPGKY